MYGIIASRQKEIDITGPMKTNNVRVLERAIVPGAPVRPKPVQNLLLGLLLGLGHGHRRSRSRSRRSTTRSRRRRTSSSSWATPVLGLVPIIGAAPGADAEQRWRQPARARPGRLPRSEVGGRRVLPLDPHEHPVHVAGSPAADDGRHQPEPAGGQDDDRDQPGRHDGGGGRPRADHRHRHAAAAPAPLVRRPEPDRHLDRHRRQGDARGGDQAHRRAQPGRADLRPGAAESVGAAAHRAVRRGARGLREALRPHHPRLAADVGGHRSRPCSATSPTASCWSSRPARRRATRRCTRAGSSRPRRPAWSASSSTRSTSRTRPTATTTTTGTTTATVTRTATARIRRRRPTPPRRGRSSSRRGR